MVPKAEVEAVASRAWEAGFRSASVLGGIIGTIPVVYEMGRSEYALEPRRRTMREIIAEVARRHGYSTAEIKSSRRHRGAIIARQEAMWLCRRETLSSLPQIGAALGNRDHTTVLHGIRRHEERMAKEEREE
jgi:chromosomal replication initiation ATPase DnaA